MNRKRLMIIGVIMLLVGGLFVYIPHSTFHIPHSVSTKAIYYCPMHPTYTSDRPGDCPICSMKLVKREPEPTSSTRHTAHGTQRQPLKDICYLHNCPKVHEGQPCPMLVVSKSGERVTCPICGSHIAEAAAPPKKILYWTDPMIPGYKSDKPGKSPMGMELTPVYEDASTISVAGGPSPSGYAPVLITPSKRQFIGITTAPASRKTLTKTIRAVGTIARDPELYQAQAEYIQAVKSVARAQQSTTPDVIEQAKRLAESAKVHLKHLGASEAMIEEIGARDEPDAGLLFAHPGKPVWMYAQVYEYELPLVRVGQPVRVDAPALPELVFRGTIQAIDPMVDPMTRTTRIRAQLDDPQGRLTPEMYVNASIAADLGEVLAVPAEAVFDTGTKRIVFVDRGQGLFEPRDVTVGMKADGDDEIKSGISEGEMVVTSSHFLLDSESRLKAALEGMAGGEHQHE